MTLYLKYRPQTIDDLDLKSVRESLKKVLSQNERPHAFLFSGPKGTGKTSAARILAKAINCEESLGSKGVRGDWGGEPCNICNTCLSITKGENLDVVEIDAASHRGIDDIRLLREAVKLAPISTRTKVYIIDEAHMLTTEACNALLKVLEEPPTHVVFILATTNPEKLLDTIRSRTTNISFVKATIDDLRTRLHKIAVLEKLTVDDNTLNLIAKAADGAFRDGVKLFEQLTSELDVLNTETVSEFLYGKKSFDPEAFVQALLIKDAKKAIEIIEHGIKNGISAKVMARGIIDLLRESMLASFGVGTSTFAVSKSDYVLLINLFSKAYSEISSSYIEQLPLELAVVTWCENEGDIREKRAVDKEKRVPDLKVETASVIQRTESKEQRTMNYEQRTKVKIETQKSTPLKATSAADTVIKTEGVFSEDMWTQVLNDLRPKNASTEALLRACKPMTFDGKALTVGVFYRFHKERLEAQPHRDLLEDTLELILGQRVRVDCLLTDPPAKKLQKEIAENKEVVLTEAKVDEKILDIAKEVFGS